MHGGASPGAPKGNGNATKHGLYTDAERVLRRQLNDLLRGSREMREAVKPVIGFGFTQQLSIKLYPRLRLANLRHKNLSFGRNALANKQ